MKVVDLKLLLYVIDRKSPHHQGALWWWTNGLAIAARRGGNCGKPLERRSPRGHRHRMRRTSRVLRRRLRTLPVTRVGESVRGVNVEHDRLDVRSGFARSFFQA